MSSATLKDLAEAVKAGQKLIIVDVRSDDEVKNKRRDSRVFLWASNPGSIHIPIAEFNDRMSEIPEGPVIVHCAVGMRAKRAGDALRAAGYHPVVDVTDCAAAKETVKKAEELAKRM
ncbi:conserved hypothetical protein [Perkinsus marinus ATCC 50983]|uniref:Rhodanese domain-containing protein n=1 Tax=Perkinsus marinus (strain ATCC 50983 / TXsc) TaxID=423536 RepID=C5K4S6_PERM5|nr:conserved hypothetical protein [Perkinsus marinus ATCC 50983]EER20348.1 conserved hypothetical protein [Perkinsus marinus ATCC 50983]|eukprot:XP_002788552.1 conserved hypothetical protein [Perkinsus marinus ATCC 50983]